MKKFAWMFAILLSLVLAGCGASSDKASTEENEAAKTVTFQSEDGAIEVPAKPKRVVALSSYTGDLINLGVNIVGADSWSFGNANFKDALKDAKEVSDEDVEGIIALKPDLIIGSSTMKNKDKLKKVAPVVTFTYNKLNYLDQHIAVGKAVNKEKEATAWAKDFEKRAEKAGDEIKAKIGENATVSVAESYDKQMYVFGDNWGRGTEILYQAMKLKMPDSVKNSALEAGYYAISPEELGNYTGDYLVLSRQSDGDNSFMKTSTYQDIPAVKNNQVLEVESSKFYFNDATTLEYQLKTFEKFFLGK
ncbi:iron-hydroxamate ABC transporter substrate-binding protein [Listeria costaricensis]|uniref:iron-hydroxamate ABC transporter substrate-binding protein n=1 Tax=Listeria costaricensis TaxID=2026604 RepID=UPI000C080D78|nr:iron-hydroxamate ABC transporter substrate-binding protein [Listeria costaricensis]